MTPTEQAEMRTPESEDAPEGERAAAATPADPMRWVARSLLLGGLVLLAVSALVIALISRPGEKGTEEAKIPTYDVTYTVTGTANVSVSVSKGGGVALPGGMLTPSKLPWTKHISMPADGTPPTMEILLGEKGGHAECAISVRGRFASRSVAAGAFGRATCGAEAPPTTPAT
ncbi:hypothetical protein [Streptomyces sp. NPDC005969]|uniref:hypothetical protein n=1 Tax=Streptomyces sp. NPDC005969 TaxID=3156722 RepID=UPI0033CF669C